MKLFKKALAVALAGVLALSVLTGCGSDSSNTISLVDALNQMGKYSGETTVFVVDNELTGENGVAGKAYNVLKEAAADCDAEEAVSDVLDELLYKDEIINELKGCFGLAADVELSKTYYSVSYLDLSRKTDNSNLTVGFRALDVMMNEVRLTGDPADGWQYNDPSKRSVGTVKGEINGKSVLIVVFKGDLEKIEGTYNPNHGQNTGNGKNA